MVLTNQMCSHLRMSQASASGRMLIFRAAVPLNHSELNAYCEHAARLHTDPATGAPLGFTEVGIQARDGTMGATCEVFN